MTQRSSSSSSVPSPQSVSVLPCRIYYSTQSGRAKACARRTARIIHDITSRRDDIQQQQQQQQPSPIVAVQLQNGHGTTFDDALMDFMKQCPTLTNSMMEQFFQEIKASGTKVLFCFISTTGDGEQTVRTAGTHTIQPLFISLSVTDIIIVSC
jgi:hypothetical protein